MEKTIQISGLSKSYDGKKVIENLSFSVAAGEVYGLLGANGVGKSTTIECILGTKKADSGTVRILGLDPWTERKQLFKQVGVQFQEANYPDKIKVKELCEETICLYRYPLAYKELLHKFGLADKENAFVNELSGGQKQRLFIVLSLIPNPRVVFLDELTTGLDLSLIHISPGGAGEAVPDPARGGGQNRRGGGGVDAPLQDPRL